MNLPPRSKTTANCRARHVGSSRAPRLDAPPPVATRRRTGSNSKLRLNALRSFVSREDCPPEPAPLHTPRRRPPARHPETPAGRPARAWHNAGLSLHTAVSRPWRASGRHRIRRGTERILMGGRRPWRFQSAPVSAPAIELRGERWSRFHVRH
jgi:hypothetical protein